MRFLVNIPFRLKQRPASPSRSKQPKPEQNWPPDQHQRKDDPENVRAEKEPGRALSTPHQIDQEDTPDLESEHHSGKRQCGSSM
jgi:hypothetical protein